MHEALCRSFGTTLDMVHDEDRPPITQRTLGLAAKNTGRSKRLQCGLA